MHANASRHRNAKGDPKENRIPANMTARISTASLIGIDAYLKDESDILRSSAVRALAGLRDGSPEIRKRLKEALLDPDPDVRSDAMEALSGIAQPEDAETIRRSLEGDPVREVKLAAIRALGRMCDIGSTDLLRALVLSRSEARVAWEDDGDWEDWLDIQITAITALGDMGLVEAVPDMLAARDDELAQTLDTPVFEALSKLGDEGISHLLAIVETESGLAAQRASGILGKLAPDRLAPHIDTLMASPDAVLRATAAGLLPEAGADIARLAESDPDPDVRRVALARAAVTQPQLVMNALRDGDARIQAAALRLLAPPLRPGTHEALIDNMLAWLKTAPPELMTETATHLAKWAPNRSTQPLLRLAADPSRPLEARVAAARGLATVRPAVETAFIVDLLENPAQQVRAAALVLLRNRAREDDAEAIDALALAILGTLFPEKATTRSPSPEDDAPDLATPKGEATSRNRIRITPEGDIVETHYKDEAEVNSTLSAILGRTPATDVHAAEDTPEERPEKRRKRRAVEGPDEIVEALSRETLQITVGLGIERIEAAILTRAGNLNDPLRRIAWQAIDAYCSAPNAGKEAVASARHALTDEDPVVRLAAFRLLFRETRDPDLLAIAGNDADPLIRAEATRWLPASSLQTSLGDDALPVRRAAVGRLLKEGFQQQIEDGVSCLIKAEHSDTLALLICHSTSARSSAAQALASQTLEKRKALVVLDAFAQIGEFMPTPIKPPLSLQIASSVAGG